MKMTTKEEGTNTQQTEDMQKGRLDHKEIYGQMWQIGIGITICKGELDKVGKIGQETLGKKLETW